MGRQLHGMSTLSDIIILDIFPCMVPKLAILIRPVNKNVALTGPGPAAWQATREINLLDGVMINEK